MMKKIITLVLSFLTVAVMAVPVDKKVAEQVAINQYALNAPSNITDYSVTDLFETTYNGIVTFYTFTFKSGGFVLVAADDASLPILGYSYEGNVSRDSYNPTAEAWFLNYSKEIADITAVRMSNTETRPAWDKLIANQAKRSVLDVPALVVTNWDQGCYYNALCPAVSGGACGRTWAGCVATTMAVLMKYHQWPATGVGYHSYTPEGFGVQSANFGSATYNYAAMPNSINSANTNIATLMYHAGVSVNMQYAAAGSGAYSEDVPFAMVNYFNYAGSTHLEAKTDYPVMNDWYALLRTELDASRPVYYAGSSAASGGHAWILDGYRLSDNKFHFNWGWSGLYNGYFAIGQLNPGGNNFNDDNRVIVGIVPGNNATSWIIQNTHFAAASRGINYMHAASEQVAWASAYDGSGTSATINEFARTINGGEIWTTGQVLGGTTYGIGNICALNGNTAYVAIYNGVGAQNNTCGVYKTTNGGTTWVQLPGALQGSASFANNVYFWNDQQGMCHGDVRDGYFEIYTTLNGGTTWQRVPLANITGPAPVSGEGGWTSVIEATGENTIMFGTNKGKVYISDDRGLTWRVTNANITPAANGGINMIAFTNPLNGIVAQTIAPVSIRKTTNGGQTWETITPSGPFLTSNLSAIPGSTGTYVTTGAAAGATGASYSTDGGLTWTMFAGTGEKQFLASDYFNSSVGYAGSFNTDQNNGGMYRMLGTLVQSPLNPPTELVAMVSGNNVSLTWNANPVPDVVRGGDRGLLGYNVYRNGVIINDSVITATNYDDNGLAAGTYEYHVRALYNDGESENSNAAVAVILEGNNLVLNFEEYSDFSLNMSPWTTLDVDGSTTFGINNVNFPNSGQPMAYIVFNPLTTTPAVTGMVAHGGSRIGACFASETPPNNDYLISPKVLLGNDARINMWVKSYTAEYGLEEYKIVVSTTDLNPSSFVTVAGPIQAPADAWTNVEYDLSAFSGQEAYVGIQCVSNKRFIFMVDDIVITFSTSTNNINLSESFNVYPNPANDVLNITGQIEVINMSLVTSSGNVVYESKVNNNHFTANISDVPAGLYILRLTTAQGVATSKVSIK